MSSDIIQPIEENLWWAIPGKLAGVRIPDENELLNLKAAGIGAVVSVLHDSSNIDLYESHQIPHQWLPIEVDSIPTPEQMSRFEAFMEAQHNEGRAVAVHCSGGKHRTGTAIATYLIRRGASYEQAMQTILEANPKIELPASQSEFLQKLAESDS